MSLLDQFGPAFHSTLRLEQEWMEYRAEHLLYYPSDPRWKGMEHWRQHNDARQNVQDRKKILWDQLSDIEQYVLDPPLENSGYDWVRNEYELKILLRKNGGFLNYEWPDPWCRLIGHLCSADDEPVRFICMDCWKMYDRDPTDGSFIVGGPDETWLAEVLNQYAKTRGASKSAPARGVSGRSLQLESSVENVQEEVEVPNIPDSGKTGPEGGR